jgi:hypothetical protein
MLQCSPSANNKQKENSFIKKVFEDCKKHKNRINKTNITQKPNIP